MSYTLQIWEKPADAPWPTTIDDALALVDRLHDGAQRQNPRFLVLAHKLTRRYPCITSPEAEALPEEEWAWSDGPLDGRTRNPVWVIGIALGDLFEEVVPFVVEQANAVGLSVTDGQGGEVYLANRKVLSIRDDVEEPFALRAIAHVENPAIKEPLPTGEDGPVITDLRNGIAVSYLVEDGNAYSYVKNRDLLGEGITPEALQERALANLARRYAQKGKIMTLGCNHILVLGGMFEASLVLLDRLWDEELAPMAPNGFVVGIPSADVIEFCDAESEDGLRQLRRGTSRAFERAFYPRFRSPFRRRDGRWEEMPELTE